MRVEVSSRWTTKLALPSLAILALCGPPSAQAEQQPSAPAAEVASPGRAVFEGVVYEPGGAPAVGAVVVSSAGGEAVTEWSGAYRLETQVPREAQRVQITAVGASAGSPAASVEVALYPWVELVPVPPLSLALGASCQQSWLPVFDEEPGTSIWVRALVVYDDGSGPALYAGGEFESIGGVAAIDVARWDGSSWTPVVGDGVEPGEFGGINAMVVFDDGGGPDLYVAGDFRGTVFQAPRGVARWDGSTWSEVVAGLSDTIWSLAVFDDGGGPRLFAAGASSTGGFVKRWNNAFSWVEIASGTDGRVRSLAVHDDGSGPALYMGGEFLLAGGAPASRIARWDGKDWSAVGGGMNAAVRSLLTLDDGNGPALFAGGNFTVAGGVSANRIARWDGSSWSALGLGIRPSGGIGPASVLALTVFDDGEGPQLHVTGSFGMAGSSVARNIARWDGSSWSAFGALTGGAASDGTDFPPNGNALAVYDNGGEPVLFVGGVFEFAGGRGAPCIARFDGARWMRLGGDGLSDEVTSLTVHDDGRGPALYAGGSFTLVGDLSARRIARWDGAGWEPLGQGLGGSFGGPVPSLASFDDGSGPALYAGLAGVMKWDGSTWTTLGDGINGTVLALTAFDHGSGPALYAGGSFNFGGGAAGNRIARWDGARWSPLGAGVVGSHVRALAVFDDGSGPALYAAGSFITAGGVAANRIARWDGSTWTPLGSGLNFHVHALAVFDDGSGPALYAGGEFTLAGGAPANRIARWDGSSWASLGSGASGSVLALTVFDDGTGSALYAGGSFTTMGGFAANRIARWDGSSWKPLSAGVSADVFALCTFDGDGGPALFVGGRFPGATEVESSYLAKWGCMETTPPSISCPLPIHVLDAPGSPSGEVVTYTVTASDDQDPEPSIESFPPSGSVFPVGTTLVTCTAFDGSGNRATCEFTVTVKDLGPAERQTR